MCIRQEGIVSKAVEFKFLNKLLVLLDIEDKQLPSLSDSGAAAAESHSIGTMETDEGLDLEQILKLLLAIDESERSGTIEQSTIKALTKCLELIWKYDVYQVC